MQLELHYLFSGLIGFFMNFSEKNHDAKGVTVWGSVT
jgi:hypothetical protein